MKDRQKIEDPNVCIIPADSLTVPIHSVLWQEIDLLETAILRLLDRIGDLIPESCDEPNSAIEPQRPDLPPFSTALRALRARMRKARESVEHAELLLNTIVMEE